METATQSRDLSAVRVETDTSIGRSYSKRCRLEKGLGEKRKGLRTKSFNVEQPTTQSLTSATNHLSLSDRSGFKKYFENTWELTDMLFTALNNDSVFYSMPDKLRRPLIFYFAHPAAVYANKVELAKLADHVNYYLQKVFETGVDEMSWDDMDDMQDEDYMWPSVAEAQDFRLKVKAHVTKLIDSMPNPVDNPLTMDSPYWSLVMGFEHERIHLETSAVLIHQLPIDAVTRPEGWTYAPSHAASPEAAPVNALITVPAGRATLGKPRDFPSFGWDNEYGRRDVDVPEFAASKYLVSNGEFYPFVMANGYETKRYWIAEDGDDEGWRWVTYRNAKHPSFWVATADMPEYFGGRPEYPYQKDDGHPKAGKGKQFKYRAMFDIIDMPWDWPVEVNCLEAKAFLRWKGEQDKAVYRLPTEAEYFLCRADPSPYDGVKAEGESKEKEASQARAVGPAAGRSERLPEKNAAGYDDAAKVDVIMQEEAPGNLNLRFGSSSPVDMFPPSAAGFHDTHGNVWEWAEDHFAPFPGTQVHYLYDDFSAPCYDGWHSLILGGSWVSTGDLASSFARYHFRRHFFQHLGFRYVKVEREEEFPGATGGAANLWMGHTKVSQALTNAFGTLAERTWDGTASLDVTPGVSYATNIAKFCYDPPFFHIGSVVGGVTFELTKHFQTAVGVEEEEVFVRHARIMKHHGQFEYDRVTEGILKSKTLIKTSSDWKRDRVHFVHTPFSEAVGAVATMAPFDVVLLDGVLERCQNPSSLLRSLCTSGVVRDSGVLVIASSNDWSNKVTPLSSWVGGYLLNGESLDTLSGLSHGLKRGFRQVQSIDLPKVTREHDRKFTVNIMQVSTWMPILKADDSDCSSNSPSAVTPKPQEPKAQERKDTMMA